MIILLILTILALYSTYFGLVVMSEYMWGAVFYILPLLMPIINLIYALYKQKRIENKEIIVKKWNKRVMITKLVLIPFYIINFVIWFMMTIVGIVPTFMFLLVMGPLIGTLYTYWLNLSTITYSIVALREGYRAGYINKAVFVLLIISQCILVLDVVGVIVYQIIITVKRDEVEKRVIQEVVEI